MGSKAMALLLLRECHLLVASSTPFRWHFDSKLSTHVDHTQLRLRHLEAQRYFVAFLRGRMHGSC